MLLKNSLAAGLLALTLAASAAAETVVTHGGEEPAIAVTGRGDLVTVWVGIDDRVNSRGVFVRLYDASGRPKGPAFLAHPEIFGNQWHPKVAADQAGNFVVVWEGDDGDLTGAFFQRFDRNGRRQGRQTRANRETAGYQLAPVVAMDRSGSFMVSWRECPVSTQDCGLRAQRFSAAGARKGLEVAVDLVATSSFGRDRFVTAIPDGFSLGWTEHDPIVSQTSEITPVIARFTPAGRPADDPPFRLSDGVRDGAGWTLKGLASGETGSVALFSGGRNSIQLFSPEGQPVGPRKVVGKRAPCLVGGDRDYWCESVLTVAMNASGHFVVLWFVDRTDIPFGPTRFDLLAQLFDPDGQPAGERFQVNQDYEASIALDAVLSDGGVLTVLWQGRNVRTSGVGLVFRRFRLAL